MGLLLFYKEKSEEKYEKMATVRKMITTCDRSSDTDDEHTVLNRLLGSI